MKKRIATEIRVDFSFKREVFLVVIGAMLGAIFMLIPTAFEVGMGLPYYVTWVAFGHAIGVYSSDAAYAGIAIHAVTAISIGIVVFFIPVYFSILLPEINRILDHVMPITNYEYGTASPKYNFPLVFVSYVIMRLFFGITVGLTSSTLSIKFGSRYRCIDPN
jgi:hypothetical protein